MARRSFATMPFLATVIADEKVAYNNTFFQCNRTISKEKVYNLKLYYYIGVCQKILERRSD